MGGHGSGRMWRWNSRRDTVEGYRYLDVRKLERDGCLRPGSIVITTWMNSRTGETVASINLRAFQDRVVLSYRQSHPGEEGQNVEETVEIAWTPCNYGGRRCWFICPGVVNGVPCRRRVAKLYGGGRYFFCRHCYRLAYASQKWDRANRLMEKARSIRMRLGGSANLFEPFPWKPKGMHWRTYWRLRRKSEQADLASWMETGRRLGWVRGMG